MDYTVRVHHEDGAYWAHVDDLPGCFASGADLDELEEAVVEAIRLYLDEPVEPGIGEVETMVVRVGPPVLA